MKRTIIIMAKAPLAGNVKTRLHPLLLPRDCAALAVAFLQDAVSKAKNACENVILAYSPPEEINVLRRLLPSQNDFIEQSGRSLGDRMFNAFVFALSGNLDSVLMIGTDSPTFPARYLEQAFNFLEAKTDAVLGKTEDGGFYLIGLRKINDEIFENVEWSSEKTFEQTVRNIEKANLKMKEIPAWYDVDEPPDLKKLAEEFRQNKAARQFAPQTFKWVEKNYKIL